MVNRINCLGRANFVLVFLVFVFIFVVFVIAAGPSWQGEDFVYNSSEDTVHMHNLTINLTGFNGDINFAFDTAQQNITWTNSSGTYDVQEDIISDWIFISNSSLGDLYINSTHDNQTGRFEIPIQALNLSDNKTSGVVFTFDSYSENDVPSFVGLENIYNLTESQQFLDFLNATDEENHYPLSFNLTFINNCTHASWTGKSNGENCSIFNLTEVSNTSAIINFTPDTLDVGTYWAYVSVVDSGANYSCPHAYCNSTTYEVNKTSSTSVVRFDVLSSLSINISNCTNQILTEGTPFSCSVDIRTKGYEDSLNISTYAVFANGYGGPVSNRSWFHSDFLANSSNFTYTVNISFTPVKREVGNWSINFSVIDSTMSESSYGLIELFVNWTEDNVTLDTISNQQFYDNESFFVYAYDNDLLIQDKITKDEYLSFSSNTSWVTISDTQTIFGNNYTTATIDIDYTQASVGGDANYSVKVNVTDTGGSFDEQIFNIMILTDNPAEWNLSKNYTLDINESERVYINLSGYVNDSDGDALEFSYSIDANSFDSFNLTTEGVMNFTPEDIGVGYHVVTVNASDGKLDSLKEFYFNITNVLDGPIIGNISPVINATEGVPQTISFNIYDDDFLIPDSQKSYYNESLSVNLTFNNLTFVTTPIFFDFNMTLLVGNMSTFWTNFTAEGDNVGVYNVTVNVTDAGKSVNVTYFTLNITSVNDFPNISRFENQTRRVNTNFHFDFNATDEEDSPTLPENGNLTFVLNNLTVGGNFLSINSTSGEVNISLNSSHIGCWKYNLSVNDTKGATTSEIFILTVYGSPNITAPDNSTPFVWAENSSVSVDFEVDYAVNNTNLTYLVYMDDIIYYNATNYNYTNLTSDESLRLNVNHTWVGNDNYTWNFDLGFADETYGLLKNLTLFVYNPLYPSLNDSYSWKVNVTHTNQNISFSGTIEDRSSIAEGTSFDINLENYFIDYDYFDEGVSQVVNFTLSSEIPGYIVPSSSFSGWVLTIGSPVPTTENLTVTGYEYYPNGSLQGTAVSNTFEVEFVDAETVPDPDRGGTRRGSSGSSSTELKHFSLKLIIPKEVIIYKETFIDVPFTVQNSGEVDFRGINLNSKVLFNDQFSEEVGIQLESSYIDNLLIGQSRDYNMRIIADTSKSGRYKATLFANVSVPKFSDWADFYIELRRVNESEVEQILLFTEKMITDNPECLELTEILNRAEEAFREGDSGKAFEIAEEVVFACESSIEANEQIKYPMEFVRKNVYYISSFTVILFVVGFVFYVYKRVKFNKYKVDDYLR